MKHSIISVATEDHLQTLVTRPPHILVSFFMMYKHFRKIEVAKLNKSLRKLRYKYEHATITNRCPMCNWTYPKGVTKQELRHHIVYQCKRSPIVKLERDIRHLSRAYDTLRKEFNELLSRPTKDNT